MTTTPPSTSRVLWHGGCRSTFLQQASLGLILIGIVVNVAWVPWLGISIGIVGLVLFPLVVIQAQVTEDAFHIFYSGRLRWPVQTIRLADVVAVEAIDVVPMKHGGWGYRGSLRLFRRAALNLRRGPGLRFQLAGDRTFVVTVNHAEEAAQAIKPLLRPIAQPPYLGSPTCDG